MKAFLEHLRVAWLQCVRAKALVGIVVMGGGMLLMAWLFSLFSMRQPLVVAVDVGFSGMRILGAFLMLTWIQESFAKDIEKRVLLAVFSYPSPRSAYVLGRFSGASLLALFALAFWGIGLYVLGTWGSDYAASSRPFLGSALIVSIVGLWFDLALIGAFMLLLVSLAQTRMLPFFVGVAFTFAARGLGPVVDYLRFSKDADPALQAALLPFLSVIQFVIPDLSRLDWRGSMLYGVWPATNQITAALVMSSGYLVMLLSLSIWAYRRREFF